MNIGYILLLLVSNVSVLEAMKRSIAEGDFVDQRELKKARTEKDTALLRTAEVCREFDELMYDQRAWVILNLSRMFEFPVSLLSTLSIETLEGMRKGVLPLQAGKDLFKRVVLSYTDESLPEEKPITFITSPLRLEYLTALHFASGLRRRYRDKVPLHTLHRLIECARLSGVQRKLIDIFVDPNKICDIAVEENDYALLKYCIQEEDDQDDQNSVKRILLEKAIEKDDVELIRWLIDKQGVSYDYDDDDGLPSILHIAARTNSCDAVRFFVEQRNVSPALTNEKNQTALHKAAKWGSLELVQYFIEICHMGPTDADDDSKNCIHVAAKYGHLAIIHYLKEHGIALDVQAAGHSTPLHKAAMQGHLDIVRFLIEDGKVEIDPVDEEDETPLCKAVENGHTAVVVYLIENNANSRVTVRDVRYGGDVRYVEEESNLTLLHRAAKHGFIELVCYLIETVGMDVNSVSSIGRTPLDEATDHDNTACVEYLIAKNATRKKR